MLLASLFHPNATDDHGLFAGTATDFVTLVELDGDRAASETYFVTHRTLAGPEGDIFMLAAGRYLDRFERRDGAWKLSHRHAIYDWNSAAPSTDNFDRANPGNWAYGVPGKEDRSYAHLAFQA